jgi:hypothetical protein
MPKTHENCTKSSHLSERRMEGLKWYQIIIGGYGEGDIGKKAV